MKFIFLLILSTTLFAEDFSLQKEKAKSDFLKLIQTKEPKSLEKIKIELWTVSPGITVTTAFGHSALRVFNGDEIDIYFDFGVYDESPSFFWKFLKGEALFYVNIVPTNWAYQSWDKSGRGIISTEFILGTAQKRKFLDAIKEIYFENEKGYYYENFTNNCVTFLKKIISKGIDKELELIQIDEEKKSWRKRVLPYSKTIFWLNIEETLLFDHDTDKLRNPNELIFLPDDLLKSIIDSKILVENKAILKNRWGNIQGKSGLIWKIIFVIIIVFALPFSVLIQFERISEILFSLVSGFSGLFASAVFFITSFQFMDQSISWLIVSPLDFIYLKSFEKWESKKIYFSIFFFRIMMIFTGLILRNTIYKQEIDNLLLLVFIFYILNLLKRKKEIYSLFKK